MDIQELKEFLKQQPPQIPQSVGSTAGSSLLHCSSPPDANLARVKPEPDACLPDLTTLIKKEPQDVLDLSSDASNASQHHIPVGTRQIQEGGKEVFIILDSDSEGEDSIELPRDVDDGMSSDTMVGDIGGFDLEDDNGSAEVNSSDSDIDSMSDIEVELPKTLWLDDGLISRVSNKPCKVTRQRTVERVEYLKDLPSYWPIPEVFVAYVLDLSDPKFNIKDKDGNLLPVDTLICNKASELSFY